MTVLQRPRSLVEARDVASLMKRRDEPLRNVRDVQADLGRRNAGWRRRFPSPLTGSQTRSRATLTETLPKGNKHDVYSPRWRSRRERDVLEGSRRESDMGEGGTPARRLTRRQFLQAGASAGVGLLVVTGCGVGAASTPEAVAEVAAGGGAQYTGPPVELGFWNGFTGGDGQVMRQLVERFNSEHENIGVDMVTIQWVDYYQKVPAAVAAGQGPDVGVMHVDQLGTNAAHGVIIPLDAVA